MKCQNILRVLEAAIIKFLHTNILDFKNSYKYKRMIGESNIVHDIFTTPKPSLIYYHAETHK